MKRVNTFEVVPQTENDRECLLRLLDASASLWNELTYERRQNYFGDGDVWDTSEYRGQYNGVVGIGEFWAEGKDTNLLVCLSQYSSILMQILSEFGGANIRKRVCLSFEFVSRTTHSVCTIRKQP